MSKLDIVLLNSLSAGSDKLIKAPEADGISVFLTIFVCVCVFHWDLPYILWEKKTGLSVLA